MEITALALFAFITSITPGPNNLMLATSGMHFGFKRSLPHAVGVSTGFTTLIIFSAFGIGTVLMDIPGVRQGLAALGSVYLLYLLWTLNLSGVTQKAFKPGNSGDSSDNNVNRQNHPLAWWQSASFQFANPKAWLMAIMGVALFLPAPHWGWQELACLCLVFFTVNLVTITLWIYSGTKLQQALAHPCSRAWCYTILVGLTLYTIAGLWLW